MINHETFWEQKHLKILVGYIMELLVFSVTPFKIDQNKKSKPFNRLNPESKKRKNVNVQRLSLRFRAQQFFLSKICREFFTHI